MLRFIEGQMHFDMQRGTNVDVGCSRFKFKHFPRACVTSGKKIIDIGMLNTSQKYHIVYYIIGPYSNIM